jgi:hypothetical protein
MFKKRTRPQTVVREISLETDTDKNIDGEGGSTSGQVEEEEPNLPSVHPALEI